MMSTGQVIASPQARPFHKRGWVVFMVGLSAAILLISGIVLFIAPSGRIANTTQWALLWLDKDGMGQPAQRLRHPLRRRTDLAPRLQLEAAQQLRRQPSHSPPEPEAGDAGGGGGAAGPRRSGRAEPAAGRCTHRPLGITSGRSSGGDRTAPAREQYFRPRNTGRHASQPWRLNFTPRLLVPDAGTARWSRCRPMPASSSTNAPAAALCCVRSRAIAACSARSARFPVRQSKRNDAAVAADPHPFQSMIAEPASIARKHLKKDCLQRYGQDHEPDFSDATTAARN